MASEWRRVTCRVASTPSRRGHNAIDATGDNVELRVIIFNRPLLNMGVDNRGIGGEAVVAARPRG